jgi:methylase of polypeptide subunit release factors
VVVALAVLLRRVGTLDRVELLATDVSDDALGLARENAVGHAVGDAIAFARADLLAGTVDPRFDLVLANLPYVRRDALPGLPIAASFEPVVALDGGTDGLAVIERLLAELPAALAEDGRALLEFGADLGAAMFYRCGLLRPGGGWFVVLDGAGKPWVARISRG